MLEFHLSTVSFHSPSQEQGSEKNNFSIYIKEPSIPLSSNRLSLYDALQLSREEPDMEDASWQSVATTNHQAIELHFRSMKDPRVLSVTIHFPSYQLAFSSYVWHQNRRAYHKMEYQEHADNELLPSLLQRIYIKHKGKITYLALLEQEKSMVGKRNS